jgi:hypothetical protein
MSPSCNREGLLKIVPNPRDRALDAVKTLPLPGAPHHRGSAFRAFAEALDGSPSEVIALAERERR